MPRRPELSHLDSEGHARMVDVAAKAVTARRAVARAFVVFPDQALQSLLDNGVPKGDVAAAARIAGIQAAKRTPEWIPLCHVLPLSSVSIELRVCGADTLEVTCAAAAEAKTGVEMEAMVGVSAAALTIYDMCKSLTKGIRITEIALIQKSGGRSGSWPA
ncbi:MAG: cyclic pyranopterin monophosphate synthase MoaC [Planctomycetota bacterium]